MLVLAVRERWDPIFNTSNAMSNIRPLAAVLDGLLSWGAERERTQRLLGHVEAMFADEWSRPVLEYPRHPLLAQGFMINAAWECLDTGALIESLLSAGPEAEAVLSRFRNAREYDGAKGEARALRFLSERGWPVRFVPTAVTQTCDLRVERGPTLGVEVWSMQPSADEFVGQAIVARVVGRLDLARHPFDVELTLDGRRTSALASQLKQPHAGPLADRIASDVVAFVQAMLERGSPCTEEIRGIGTATMRVARGPSGALAYEAPPGRTAPNKLAACIEKAEQLRGERGVLWIDTSRGISMTDAIPVIEDALATRGKAGFPNLCGAFVLDSTSTYRGVVERVAFVGDLPELDFERRCEVLREGGGPAVEKIDRAFAEAIERIEDD